MRSGRVRSAEVCIGKEWLCGLSRGSAMTADSSTEGSPSLLFSREQVWHGDASFGMASWGTVSWAMAGLLGLRLTPQALNFIY